MIRGRLRRRRGSGGEGEAATAGDEYIEIDPSELRGIFTAPDWLRDIGVAAWLLVGVAVALVGLIWILGLTQVIVAPVIVASVVAAVASPLVAWLHRRGRPRILGAIVVLLLIVAAGVGMVTMVVGGITGQSGDITAQLDSAKETMTGWLEDIGVEPSHADQAEADV